MYYDNLVERIEQVLERGVSEHRKHWETKLSDLHSAKLVLMDAKQVEIFTRNSYPLENYPHFIFDNIFVNFTRPVEMKWDKPVYFQGKDKIMSKSHSAYQGILITKTDLRSYMGVTIPSSWELKSTPEVADGFIDKICAAEPVSGGVATWYETLPRHEQTLDAKDVTISPTTFPKPGNYDLHNKFNMPLEQRMLLNNVEADTKLLKATVSILYFLSCENIAVKYHEPSKSKEVLKKMGQKTVHPFYTVEFKRGGDRTKPHETGKGGTHSFRYDVGGHFRHLRHERYLRNKDGTYKVFWIGDHQRGLANELYIPALRDATKVPKTFPD